MAHRGASAEAPENTLAAIERAWDYGVDGVEVDIHLSADGECVVIHDPTTARTTNANRRVSECTAEELRRLDAGSWKGAEFAGQRIPLIEEVLERIPPGKFQCIELKDGEGLEEALHERLVALGREDSVCVLAFDPERIERFKKRLPEVPAFLLLAPEVDLTAGTIRPFSEKVIEWVKACGADAPACFEGAVTKAFVEQVHAAGMPLLVWVVDEPARARELAAWGVDALATNDPAKLLPALET